MTGTTPRKILVIDDDPDIRTYLSEILHDNGYDSVTAADGIDGLARARDSRPDLVLLDLMMPRKSGIRFLNEARRDDTLKAIPIIIVSGASRATGVDMKQFLKERPFADRKEKVMGAGADAMPDAYLDKPVDPAVLVEAVRKLLG